MWHAMRRAGHDVGRDQVGRPIGIAGVHGAVRGRHHTITTRREPTAVGHSDLVKRGWSTPARPDQLWVADFSYVWTLAGVCYVSLVTYVYFRRILGWRVSAGKHTALVTAALQRAPTPARPSPPGAPGPAGPTTYAHNRTAPTRSTSPNGDQLPPGSTDVTALRRLHPEVPVLTTSSDEARPVVSEPLRDQPRSMDRGPGSTLGVVREGHHDMQPFQPVSPRT